MKPMLATDADLDKVKFPVLVFPKIDGVRALNVAGKLVGRSGKQFKNKLNTSFFSKLAFSGFDGEMVVDRIKGSGICNETTSAMTTIEGHIQTRWCLFDRVIEGANETDSFLKRYRQLEEVVSSILAREPELRSFLWVIPFKWVHDKESLMETEIDCINQGYEGVILRDPHAPYKFGRSTAKEGGFLRMKQFMDAEIEITSVVEGKSNQNELRANPHGYAERSTHASNMVPNGMVGSILGRALQDSVDSLGNVVIQKGSEVEVAAGKLNHHERKYFFENQTAIIGRIAKFQFFPIGIKDKPRFPTFQSFRSKTDMS